jgi:hypothetical protein
LNGVWGNTSDDVWAVGGNATNGTVLRLDGRSWTSIPVADVDRVNTLAAVWGSAPHDVWAVGVGGTILHCLH